MCIKGPTLMSGYLGKSPEECFDAEGFYCTGDGGWVDEQGRFFWEGRLTDMIKTGGLNVYSQEVEHVLLTHPAVRVRAVGGPDTAVTVWQRCGGRLPDHQRRCVR